MRERKFSGAFFSSIGSVSSFHRFTMAKEAEFHEISLHFMKSARIS
jgi:hypothetical protein